MEDEVTPSWPGLITYSIMETVAKGGKVCAAGGVAKTEKKVSGVPGLNTRDCTASCTVH
jgi:hypothetical protein